MFLVLPPLLFSSRTFSRTLNHQADSSPSLSLSLHSLSLVCIPSFTHSLLLLLPNSIMHFLSLSLCCSFSLYSTLLALSLTLVSSSSISLSLTSPPHFHASFSTSPS